MFHHITITPNNNFFFCFQRTELSQCSVQFVISADILLWFSLITTAANCILTDLFSCCTNVHIKSKRSSCSVTFESSRKLDQ